MLQKALQPHLLRRFKRDVLKDLPLRKEVIVRIELTQAQKDLSKKILLRNMQTLIDLEKGKNATSTATLSNIYIYMRLIADHTCCWALSTARTTSGARNSALS